MLYLTVICGANLLFALLHSIGQPSVPHFFAMLGLSLLYTASVIAVDGILAFLIRRLPERWFSPERNAFSVCPRERRLYAALGVKRWKDYVPELGVFTGFHKNRLESATDRSYLQRFLLESNYGVVIHLSNVMLGFLILLLPFGRSLSLALPVASVNAVLSLLPIMILRYHTPPLLRLYHRSLKSDTAKKRK